MCMCVHVPTEARRCLGFFEAGVTGFSELLSVYMLAIKFCSSRGGAGTQPLSYFSGPGKLFLPYLLLLTVHKASFCFLTNLITEKMNLTTEVWKIHKN